MLRGGCVSGVVVWILGRMFNRVDELDVQATLRLADGSVYFVLLGSGLAGRLGVSC